MMKNKTHLEVLQDLGNYVVYYPNIAKAIGNVNAGIFLCNIIGWSRKKDWIYKTANEVYDDTGLSRKEQVNARKKLLALGCIEEKLKGVPAKLHYHINYANVETLIQTYIDKQEQEEKVVSSSEPTPIPTTEPTPTPTKTDTDDQNIKEIAAYLHDQLQVIGLTQDQANLVTTMEMNYLTSKYKKLDAKKLKKLNSKLIINENYLLWQLYASFLATTTANKQDICKGGLMPLKQYNALKRYQQKHDITDEKMLELMTGYLHDVKPVTLDDFLNAEKVIAYLDFGQDLDHDAGVIARQWKIPRTSRNKLRLNILVSRLEQQYSTIGEYVEWYLDDKDDHKWEYLLAETNVNEFFAINYDKLRIRHADTIRSRKTVALMKIGVDLFNETSNENLGQTLLEFGQNKISYNEAKTAIISHAEKSNATATIEKINAITGEVVK